jgi:CRP/FNR family cyclic AMP-dependent transcriptional regulator
MTTRDKTLLLRRFPFFGGLEHAVVTSLAVEAQWLQIPRHHYIYRPGSPSDAFYLLVKGRIKTGEFSPDHKESIRHILHPLAYFGELSLTGEEQRTGFALAMHEGCSLLAIPAENMLRQMLHNFQLNLMVMRLFGRRVRHAEHRVNDLIYKDARTRIVDFIRDTVFLQGRRVGKEIFFNHGLTQQDIASITGTSRQTVTMVMNELRRTNWIHFTRNSIIIRDPEKIRAYTAH